MKEDGAYKAIEATMFPSFLPKHEPDMNMNHDIY
jgi:hypothetical protein